MKIGKVTRPLFITDIAKIPRKGAEEAFAFAYMQNFAGYNVT
jgi:hypothetical protein